jgi:hypothetical protein
MAVHGKREATNKFIADNYKELCVMVWRAADRGHGVAKTSVADATDRLWELLVAAMDDCGRIMAQGNGRAKDYPFVVMVEDGAGDMPLITILAELSGEGDTYNIEQHPADKIAGALLADQDKRQGPIGHGD